MAAVLIVEDDPICQKINTSLCKLSGMEASIAETGQQALDFLAKNTYDLILMDIGLPDMSGIEVASKVRENQPNIPIVAVTAHMSKDQQCVLPNGPFNKVVHKPLMKQIINKIQEEFLS